MAGTEDRTNRAGLIPDFIKLDGDEDAGVVAYCTSDAHGRDLAHIAYRGWGCPRDWRPVRTVQDLVDAIHAHLREAHP